MAEQEFVRPVPHLTAAAALARILATLERKPAPKLPPRQDDEMQVGLSIARYEHGPQRRS